jgi:hypothetical protein
MRLRTIAVLLYAAALSAQVAIDPARYRPLIRYLDPQPGETSFVCEVTPIRPSLNFSFRFQAGYAVRVPMGQFPGSGHRWNMVVEILPVAGGPPAYFGRQLRLPEIPPTRKTAEFAGGYLLGEGQYRARWVMLDERLRVCRRQWTVEVKPRPSERRVKLAMQPNTVEEFAWENSFQKARPADADAAPRSLTVLLDIAPLSLRRQRLRAADRLLLIALTSSVLESVPAKRVRLVAFSLDQQREIFRRDALAPGDLDQLEQVMEGVELATVDYRVLQNPGGYQRLLSGLVERELAASPPSDTVLFLGPAVRYLDKVAANFAERPASFAPRFYYFQYRPILRGPVAYLPDTIDRLVSRLKGKNLVIRTPADFQKAIEQMGK